MLTLIRYIVCLHAFQNSQILLLSNTQETLLQLDCAIHHKSSFLHVGLIHYILFQQRKQYKTAVASIHSLSNFRIILYNEACSLLHRVNCSLTLE